MGVKESQNNVEEGEKSAKIGMIESEKPWGLSFTALVASGYMNPASCSVREKVVCIIYSTQSSCSLFTVRIVSVASVTVIVTIDAYAKASSFAVQLFRKRMSKSSVKAYVIMPKAIKVDWVIR